MKLLLCRECGDIVQLLSALRYCRCGRAWGRYEDERYASIGGSAEVLLLDNGVLHLAMVQRHYAAADAPHLVVGEIALALPAHPHVRRAE